METAMEIYEIAIYIYFSIGVIFSFFGPLARKISIQDYMVSLQKDVSNLKRISFILVLRLGVILFYPYFIYSN